MFFDNSLCLTCGSSLGYVRAERSLVALTESDGTLLRADGTPGSYRWCANRELARCNWLVAVDDAEALCESCRLTSVRPNDAEVDAHVAFADAETAKRRLVSQLDALDLPIVPRAGAADADPEHGLTFEFLSSRGRSVTTGHQSGVITLDLSESDDAHREFVRQQLGEPYRTVLGHLRHEIGHYYWPMLVERAGLLDEYRSLFGDERASYEDALSQHYGGGSSADWVDTHVSQYATMHPWEDWAETFAHYLHIHGGLETSDAFGIEVGEPSRSAGAGAWASSTAVAIGPMIGTWLGLTFALNAMSRSIGQPDLYPFVLSPTVVSKLDFVHRAITSAAAGRSAAGGRVSTM